MGSPRIGLALGSGAARGWAHIGVLQSLEEMGVKPDVISGCSAGAIVAGAHAGGNLQKLADWLVTLTRRTVLGFFDFSFLGGGVITGEKLFDFFKEHIGDSRIEDLPIPFTAIATELTSGREVWIDSVHRHCHRTDIRAGSMDQFRFTAGGYAGLDLVAGHVYPLPDRRRMDDRRRSGQPRSGFGLQGHEG